MHFFFSPFIVPLGAFAVGIVAILAGSFQRVQTERLRAEQRMALLARGLPLAEVERALLSQNQVESSGVRVRNPERTAGGIRLTAILLISSGLSLAVFFVVLAIVLHEPQVYSGAATGLIPLGIGIGFSIDYRIRVREIARLRDEGQL